MSLRIAALMVVGMACGIASAYAQESSATGPGVVEVTYMPADAAFFTSKDGVKWYAPNNRWGLRGDYRFCVTKSKDGAPEFFGRENRYVHRVYAAIVINTVR